MIDVNLLGTGGMYPLPYRFLTALMLRHNGGHVLVDCGEGTQVAIRSGGLGFKKINTICITHFHADHISGLPGLLLTIGNSGRTEPVTIIGPKGLKNVVQSLCIIAPYLPFGLDFREIDEENELFRSGDLKISVQRVEHEVACYGYSFKLERQGVFDPIEAKKLGIPVGYWSKLQAGEDVEVEGRLFKSAMVMGEKRRGLKVTYTTDLRPSKEMETFAECSDLFVCEGNYGDPEKQEKAIEHKHCMFSEAAKMAKNAGVEELWLTHFSPSMTDPEEYVEHATDIFSNTYIDRQSTTLHFK